MRYLLVSEEFTVLGMLRYEAVRVGVFAHEHWIHHHLAYLTVAFAVALGHVFVVEPIHFLHHLAVW